MRGKERGRVGGTSFSKSEKIVVDKNGGVF